MIKDKYIQEEQEIKELRSLRNQIRAKNSLTIKSTEDILNAFNSDKGSTLVTFKELYSLEIGKIYDVNNGVSFVMLSKSEKHLVFETYMQDGGEFGLQEHDCYEFCEVLKGNLIEKERGYKVYTEGDFISYSPNEKHKPYSTKDSIYRVVFIKNIDL